MEFVAAVCDYENTTNQKQIENCGKYFNEKKTEFVIPDCVYENCQKPKHYECIKRYVNENCSNQKQNEKKTEFVIPDCVYLKCKKQNHNDCIALFIQRRKEASKKHYHEKYKNEHYICDCGIKVSRCNRGHQQTEKHMKLLAAKNAQGETVSKELLNLADES